MFNYTIHNFEITMKCMDILIFARCKDLNLIFSILYRQLTFLWFHMNIYKGINNIYCIYENSNDKKWATLFKPRLSGCSGSDFMKLCFKTVKTDFRQLKPTKINCLRITFFSNFKGRVRINRKNLNFSLLKSTQCEPFYGFYTLLSIEIIKTSYNDLIFEKKSLV